MADTKVSSAYQDIYDTQADMLELAKKMFFADSEDIDISQLKPSIFGFMSQTQGRQMESSTYHSNAFFDEAFINTASFSSSIFNYSKLYKVPVANAKPSLVNCTLAIKESDIINFSTIENAQSKFKINRISNFKFENYNFMLPNSINIVIKKSGSTFNFDTKYDLNDYNIKDYAITNPFIKTWRTTVNSERWLFLNVQLLNIKKVDYEYEILTTDLSDILSFKNNYSDQLAGFTISVKEPNKTDFRVIEWGEFNPTSPPIDVEEYYYYTFPNDSSINIYFPSAPDWRPRYGTRLKISIYTTNGTLGNFSYSGLIKPEIITPEEDVYKGYRDTSNLLVSVKNLTDAAGGRNRMTIIELKKMIIGKILSRENLITEIDLNSFFSTVVNTNSINQGKFFFLKQQDDVLKRLFAAFILLRDENENIVPSNTVDLSIDYQTLVKKDFCLKPGEIVLFDEGNKVYRFLDEDEFPETFVLNKKSLVYSVPYLMHVKLSPFPRIVYYINDVSHSIDMNYDFTPIHEWDLIIDGLSIERNGLYDNFYKFSVSLNTNIDDTLFAYPGLEDTVKSDFLKLRLIFKNSNANGGEAICLLDLDKIDQTNIYSEVLFTDDKITHDGDILLTSGIGKTSLKNLRGQSIQSIYLPEDFRVELAILYNSLPPNNFTMNEEVILSKESLEGKEIFQAMEDLKGVDVLGRSWFYGIAAVFSQDREQTTYLHKNLTNLSYSDLVINSDASVMITNVPLIGTKYFADRARSKNVNKILRAYEDILEQNIDKLENNTQISIKFFNTYGISKLYDIDTTNLFIQFKIKLYSSLTQELDLRIKTAIAAFVEASNDLGFLNLSNIITMLEKNFVEIQYINIVGINDLGRQGIRKNTTKAFDQMEKKELTSYVPEYFSVNLEKKAEELIKSIYIEYL